MVEAQVAYRLRSVIQARKHTGFRSEAPHVDGPEDRLLMPSEVAELFRVGPKTVTRWAVSGRIGSIRTPGGHRRYRESEIHQLLAALTEPASELEEIPGINQHQSANSP